MVKKCQQCQTIWKDEWLDETQPTMYCPFCYTEWDGKTMPPIGKAKRQITKSLATMLPGLEANLQDLDYIILQVWATDISDKPLCRMAHEARIKNLQATRMELVNKIENIKKHIVKS